MVNRDFCGEAWQCAYITVQVTAEMVVHVTAETGLQITVEVGQACHFLHVKLVTIEENLWKLDSSMRFHHWLYVWYKNTLKDLQKKSKRQNFINLTYQEIQGTQY